MVRTNQGGSILSFVVLGVVMALLLIGGAYVVRHNLAPAEKGTQVAVSGKTDDSSKQAPSSSQSGSTPQGGQPEDSSGTFKPNPAPSTSDTTTGGSAQNTPAPESVRATDGKTANGLPTTGPSGALLAGSMLSTLVALSVVYLQSRRSGASL